MSATSARKKRKPGRRAAEFACHVVEIADWDWSFMFGASNAAKIDGGPYSGYRHLHIEGKLLLPHNPKITHVRLVFIPSRHLDSETDRARDQPLIIGHLRSHRGTLDGILSIPLNALPPVLQMLISGQFKYIVLDGDKPRYGQANVRTYRMEKAISEDDLV